MATKFTNYGDQIIYAIYIYIYIYIFYGVTRGSEERGIK